MSEEDPRTVFYPLNIEKPTVRSLFIEMFFGETLLSVGTATLVAKSSPGHCAIITNRHNVTGRNQDTGECLSKTLGTPDCIVIHLHRSAPHVGEWMPLRLPLYDGEGEPLWIEHPDLQAKADVVAININWGDDVLCLPYYTQQPGPDRIGMLVSPAEPVSVIGFPFGIATSGKLPVWATGFLAQELSLISKEMPVFLIDCRSRQGQSGSPVIAFRTSGYRAIRGGKVSASLSGAVAWEFLGIYAGRVNPESDLGRVWHVSVLDRLLEAAEADYARRKGEAPQGGELVA